MTNIVGEHEYGRTRVFHFEPVSGDRPMFEFQDALGVQELNVADVQPVILADLGAMSFSQFLAIGYEIDADALAEQVAKLDALSGTVFIVRSGAFLNAPLTLQTDGAAQLIATFIDPTLDTAFPTPIESTSAEGILTQPAVKKKPSDAAMSGRVATIALLVMAFLVWLMIKVAG